MQLVHSELKYSRLCKNLKLRIWNSGIRLICIIGCLQSGRLIKEADNEKKVTLDCLGNFSRSITGTPHAPHVPINTDTLHIRLKLRLQQRR
jgi:hypothetical protein